MGHQARVPVWGKMDQPMTMKATEYRVYEGHVARHRQKVSDARCDFSVDHCAKEFDKLCTFVSRLDHAKQYHNNKALGEIQKDNERLMQKMYVAMADRQQTRMEDLYQHDMRLLTAVMSKDSFRQKRENVIHAENNSLTNKLQATKSSVPTKADCEDHAASVARLSRHRRPLSARGAPRTPPRSPSRQGRPATPNTARGTSGGSRPSSATYHRRLMHPARDPLSSPGSMKESKWWQSHGERFAPANEACQFSLLARAKAEAVEKLHNVTIALGVGDFSPDVSQDTGEARDKDWWRTVGQPAKAESSREDIREDKDTSLMADSSFQESPSQQEAMYGDINAAEPSVSSFSPTLQQKDRDDDVSTSAPSPQVRTDRGYSSPTSMPSAFSPSAREEEQADESKMPSTPYPNVQAPPTVVSQPEESRMPANQHARIQYIQAAASTLWAPAAAEAVAIGEASSPSHTPTAPMTSNLSRPPLLAACADAHRDSSSPRSHSLAASVTDSGIDDGRRSKPDPSQFRILEARRTVA